MEIEYVTKLIELISSSKVDEIEIEEDGKKIRIVKTHQGAPAPTVFQVAAPSPSQGTQVPAAAISPQTLQPQASAPAAVQAPPATGVKLHEVKSPIVGTFYRSPAPDAPPFVQVGTVVQKGSVLCIVEAMKLMNEIESDVAGKIVQISVETGQPIEYDQVLFTIEPA